MQPDPLHGRFGRRITDLRAAVADRRRFRRAERMPLGEHDCACGYCQRLAHVSG